MSKPFLIFSVLILFGQNNFFGFPKMESKSDAAIKSILIGFIAGNVIAWSMGAYPRSFDEVPYSTDERTERDFLKEEVSQNPDEFEINRDFGALLTRHNEIDEAGSHLRVAKEKAPQDSETLAWWSSNEMKLTGAMWDFTWGIWKLNRLGKARRGLTEAVALDIDNPISRLVRINTLAAIDEFDTLPEDEAWYLKQKESLDFTPTLESDFNLSLSYAFARYAEADDNNRQEGLRKSLYYLKAFEKLEFKPNSPSAITLTKTRKLIEEIKN